MRPWFWPAIVLLVLPLGLVGFFVRNVTRDDVGPAVGAVMWGV